MKIHINIYIDIKNNFKISSKNKSEGRRRNNTIVRGSSPGHRQITPPTCKLNFTYKNQHLGKVEDCSYLLIEV